ncbi:MAG: hypothetical protein CME59_13390 [Halioglobus sp.]|nr:hypothetical protein [Halioglobus sp.]|tara:strand:- start:2626 stop:3519 length:894 start_codon:yes stop_codon:yes gene_type:complete
MDVRDIELIHAVYEAGSLSRACTRLNMSQPTLSKKLARLEHVMDTELFHRYPKGLVPTDTARYILSRAEPLRAHLAEIERHVQLMTQLDKGRLNLGVGPIIEQVMLPEVLKTFVESTGEVELSIVTENEETLLSMFWASELDIVVGPFQAQQQKDEHIVAMPMITDRIIAVARPGHPVFDSKTVEMDTLIHYSWVAPKPQGTVQQIGDHPILSRMKVLSDNYDILKKLTISSDVVCAGPRTVFKSELDAGALSEISVSLDVTWESALLVKPETYATPLAKHLVATFESARARHQGVA